ncbi:MAG TPA: 3-hydroxyacyl-CoA dehydrogenase family protein [Fibrobacteria bacterium]|nr:3-hydroxyacyl-CoA dehydrogenase family protein [Fibrobacteria bacterium]
MGTEGMGLDERLRAVAVLGAGGKMGSGIAWVALKAMAERDAREHGVPGSGAYDLALIDADPAAFKRLRNYLEGQLRKTAEKGIGDLRTWARDRADLIENGEIIEAYVDGAMSMVRCESDAAAAKPARLVFEAVFEDLELKKGLYARLKSLCGPDTLFLTNTSSIPISLLDQSAGLDGRILGFHFYNPPAVQKLVEMISGARTRPQAVALGRELGTAFGKTVVPSNDVAGFIGNGHFIRELLFALGKFRALRPGRGGAETLLLLNRATQDFLIRPMGVFQLLDYVGLDVFRMILKVMRTHLDPAGSDGTVFADETLEAWLAAGVRGGQIGSGEQKDGLFRYERNKIAAVLDPDALAAGKGITYVSLAESARGGTPGDLLGPLPAGHAPWNALAKDPGKKGKLAAYLAALAAADSPGARLGREFLDHSRAVGAALVRTGVAASDEDVSQVLMNGFFHLYGPADWTHHA